MWALDRVHDLQHRANTPIDLCILDEVDFALWIFEFLLTALDELKHQVLDTDVVNGVQLASHRQRSIGVEPDRRQEAARRTALMRPQFVIVPAFYPHYFATLDASRLDELHIDAEWHDHLAILH